MIQTWQVTDTRKSTSGYVYALVGGAISLCYRLERIVALSTIEAEYISGTKASKDAIWLARLCSEVGMHEKAFVLGCYSYRCHYVWQRMQCFMLAQSILM